MSAVKLYDMATGHVETLESSEDRDTIRRAFEAIIKQDRSSEHVIYIDDEVTA